MDAQDVITVEESPSKTKHSTKNPSNCNKVMYYQPNQEFPVAEQTMIWSRNTTNFINQSMNLIQHNRMPLNNNKPMSFINLGVQNRPFLSPNGFGGIRNFPRPPYTLYNYDPYLTSFQMNNFASIRHPNYVFNNTNNNFWMKVKLEEIPDKGEIVSQFYIDDKQNPVKICDLKQQNDSLPEFIDVNSLAKQRYNQAISNDQSNLTVLSSFQTEDKNKNKKSVPLFLKRNRMLHNNNIKVKTNEENVNINNNDDIIFVGEYKNEIPLQSVESEKEIVQLIPEQSTIKDESINSIHMNKNYSKFSSRRKRKDRSLIPPRRNPKRQVQIHKEFLKMIDYVILESEKDEKMKKTVTKINKTTKSGTKRTTRVSTGSTNGATYNPPSPLTTEHFRDWPVDGMHERPEFNPKTGKIEPFDQLIRSISDKYNQSNKDSTNVMTNNEFSKSEKEKSFPELCHDMLHHVLAYVTTMKALEKQKDMPTDGSKVQFLEQLELAQNSGKIENTICDILKTILDEVFEKDETDLKFPELTDLLKQNILLYCLTNNVNKSDVANYIANVKPEDIIKLSNEQFKLLSLNEN